MLKVEIRDRPADGLYEVCVNGDPISLYWTHEFDEEMRNYQGFLTLKTEAMSVLRDMLLATELKSDVKATVMVAIIERLDNLTVSDEARQEAIKIIQQDIEQKVSPV